MNGIVNKSSMIVMRRRNEIILRSKLKSLRMILAKSQRNSHCMISMLKVKMTLRHQDLSMP